MFATLTADLRHYSRFCYGGAPVRYIWPYILYAHPAAAGVIWYRFGAMAWRSRVPVLRHLLLLIYALGMPVARLYSGIQIQPQTKIGPGLAILHFGAGVITRECEIGENCLLYHNVSLVTMKSQRGPQIGRNFYAGVGTTVIGDVTIEDDVTCGAGSVVTRSVPKDAVVAGVPARILRFREAEENNAENQTQRARPPSWMKPPSSGTTGVGLDRASARDHSSDRS